MDWTIFKLRAKILQAIRQFFILRNYLEIDAPTLTTWPTLDNNILSLETDVHDMQNRTYRHFMHTSPEHAMKKLLADGSGNIFFLGKVFRDNEITRLHNPEFTMAEWYQVDANYHDLLDEIQALITDVAGQLNSTLHFFYQDSQMDFESPWPVRTIASLFEEYVDLNDNDLLNSEKLRSAAVKLSIHFNPSDNWETLFHRIFIAKIEPNLGFSKPTFVTDYPAQMGLMAKRKDEDPRFVERVELFIKGIELANGYTELRDPEELRDRFTEQQRLKSEAGVIHYPIDEELLGLLPQMPPCAGIALGVDRLIMLLLNKPDIRDVIYFPMHSKEN